MDLGRFLLKWVCPALIAFFFSFFFFTGLSVFYFDELKLLFTKRADIGRLAP